MPLAEWFLKHYNGDVTGVGKAPLRKRFSKYRQSRIKRKRSFMAAKIIQKKGDIKQKTTQIKNKDNTTKKKEYLL